MTSNPGYRLGVDVGGTFTDLVLAAPDGRALTRKVLSSAANCAEDEYARREYGVAIDVEAQKVLSEESAQLRAARGK